MNEIKIYEYQNQPIQFDVIGDKVMANATLMCGAFGKRSNDWLRTESTQRYINALASAGKCVLADLVIVRNGGNDNGTWVDEKLILALARWLDVEFEIWCDEKIAELLKNKTVSILPQNYLQALEALVESEKSKQQAIEMVEELKPKAAIAEALTSTSAEYNMSEAAKILEIIDEDNKVIGRNKFFKCLRNSKVLMDDNEPYQKYIDQGYFKFKTNLINGYFINSTYVTGKGLAWMQHNREKMFGVNK